MEKPAVESIVKTAGNGTKRWYNRMKKQTAAITAVVCVFCLQRTHSARSAGACDAHRYNDTENSICNLLHRPAGYLPGL